MDFSIVQTWKHPTDMPKPFELASRTWRHHNPDAGYSLIPNDHIIAWMLRKYPFAVQHGRPLIGTLDMWRYCHLLTYGGLYADMDFWCLQDFAPLLEQVGDQVMLGRIPQPEGYTLEPIGNDIMYAGRPGHPFWLLVLAISQMPEYRGEKAIALGTGPGLIWAAMRRYEELESGAELRAEPGVAVMAERCRVEIPYVLPGVELMHEDVLHPIGWHWDLPEDYAIRQRFARDDIDYDFIEKLRGDPDCYAFTFYYQSWSQHDLLTT